MSAVQLYLEVRYVKAKDHYMDHWNMDIDVGIGYGSLPEEILRVF